MRSQWLQVDKTDSIHMFRVDGQSWEVNWIRGVKERRKNDSRSLGLKQLGKWKDY